MFEVMHFAEDLADDLIKSDPALKRKVIAILEANATLQKENEQLKERIEKTIAYLNKRAYADKELTIIYANKKEILEILEGKQQ